MSDLQMYYGMFLVNCAGEFFARPEMHIALAAAYYTCRLVFPDSRGVFVALLHQYATGVAFMFSAAALAGRAHNKHSSSPFVRIGIFAMLMTDSMMLEYAPSIFILPACLFTPVLMSADFGSRQWHVVAVVVQLAWSALHVSVHMMFWRTFDRSGSRLASVWSWVGGSLVVCKFAAHAAPAIYARVQEQRRANHAPVQ